MNISLNGNTLTDGYFAGLFTGPIEQLSGSGPYSGVLPVGEGYFDYTNEKYYMGDGSTMGGVLIGPSTTGGTVTSVSAGNLSPLFTTSVATPTSTPALSFSLSNAGANTILGNSTGSGAAPSYTGVSSFQGTSASTFAAGNDTRFPANVTGLRKGAGAGSADTAAVAGTDYLAPGGSGGGLTGLNSYNTISISAAGNTNFSRTSIYDLYNVTVTGSSASSISLLDTGAIAGDIKEVFISMPGTTAVITVYDGSTSGTLLATLTGTGTAGATTLTFVYNGTMWTAFKKGALLLMDNLSDLPSASTALTNLGVTGTNVQAALADATNGANGLVQLDSSGNLPSFSLGSAATLTVPTGGTIIVNGTLEQRHGSGPAGSVLHPGEGYFDTTGENYYLGDGSTSNGILVAGNQFYRGAFNPGATGSASSTGSGGAGGTMANGKPPYQLNVGPGAGGPSTTAHNGGAGGSFGMFGATFYPITILGGLGGASGAGGNGGVGGSCSNMQFGIYAAAGTGGAGSAGSGAGGGGGALYSAELFYFFGGQGGTAPSVSGNGGAGGYVSSAVNLTGGNAGTGGTTAAGGAGGNVNIGLAFAGGYGGNASGTYAGGVGGTVNGISATGGGGANAGAGGAGGAGGTVNTLIVATGGNGGAGASSGGYMGGAGGATSTITLTGGNGGSASTAAAGPAGGGPGGINLIGGNAGASSGAYLGGVAGAAGTITLSGGAGGAANTAGAGGAGAAAGSINLSAGAGGAANTTYSGGPAGTGGSISATGGAGGLDAYPGGNGGSLTMNGFSANGASVMGGSAGSINTSGGNHGGSIGGSINTSCSATATASTPGGNIYTYASANAVGGNLNTYGSNYAGGSLNLQGTTSYIGGTINLTGAVNTVLTSGSTQYTVTIPAIANLTLADQPLMTANTTATVTFNSVGQTETQYNISTAQATVTINLPTTSVPGQRVTYATGVSSTITMGTGTLDIGTAPTSTSAGTVFIWQCSTSGHWIRLQ